MFRFELSTSHARSSSRFGSKSFLRVAMIVGCAAAGYCRAEDVPMLPAVPTPSINPDGIAAGSTIQIRRIEVVGSTVFDSADIQALVDPFLGRALGPDDLEELRVVLTRHYIDAGYINSGALIPAQSIVDGVLRVQIVEGHLSAANISGEHHYRERWLRGLILTDSDAPLNLNQLQERIQLLLQDGLLQQVNAQLEPGDAPGESILDAVVREGSRFKLSFSAADDRPPSVGETGGTIGLSGRNLLGRGDNTSVGFGLTHGYTDYALDESIPLWVPSVSIFLRADKNHGSVLENSLKELGIFSRETSAEVGISSQIVHGLKNSLNQSLSLYYNDTRTYLMGIPFSFSGDDDGHSKVSALRYVLDWTYRGTRQVVAVRSLTNVGLGGVARMGATVHEDSDLPDSRFVVWNVQAQYLRQISDDDEVLTRASLQFASRNLLSSEKIAIGGIDTVRGYAANTLVRDQGGFASAEYRHTVYRLRVPGVSRDAKDGGLALAAFYDAGVGDDRGDAHTWISGTGGGVRWSPAANCNMVFYKGVALHHLPNQAGGLQEQGLHFRFNYDLDF